MSNSSFDDYVEKEATVLESNNPASSEAQLTEQEKDLLEASQPPFTQPLSPDETIAKAEHGSALEPVASTRPSVNDLKAVPNGGLWAWLQVVGSFFIFWNAWGIINTFGTYQTFYETSLLSSKTPSDIAWIGSVQATLLMVVGSFAGPLYDAGYIRQLLLVGSVLVVLGQMMLSLCTNYAQVFLAQAVCQGIGTGLIFVPSVAILSQYFSTKIATATGLAASGSSLGGVVYPIVFHRLEPKLGFPWATRILGFMMMGTLVISNICLRVRVLPEGKRKFWDKTAFKEAPYVLYVFGLFLTFMGLYDPFFYAQSYALDTRITNPNLAFYMLSVINAASTFGRIIPGYISDKIGPLNMIIPCSLMAGVVSLCLIATHSTAGLIVALAFYGFFSGTLVSLPPTIFVHLTKNRAVIGARMGMGFAIIAIGLLVGTPISGAILVATGKFAYVWLFGGLLTIFGTCLIIGTRICRAGYSLRKKV